MKRSIAGLFVAALLGGAGGSAQAQSLSVNLTINLSGLGLGSGCGSCCGSNGGCGKGRICLPPPGWSPEYPRPVMYGGLSASPPYQGGYYAPYGGYGYAPPPLGYGSGRVYGWMLPAAPVATPKISTVPPPEPATGSPK